MALAPSAATTCARCGVFLEPEGAVLVEGRRYCPTCAARSDVDYLEAYRQRYWGRRDVWTWLVGLSVPVSLVQLVTVLASQAWLALPGAVLGLVIGAAFFLGRSWARWGLGINLLLGLAVASITLPGELWPVEVGTVVLAMAVWALILFDTRNRLFFKLPVSREKLRADWNLYENNATARSGFMLSLLALIVWPLAALSLPLSVAGLMKVDPRGSPPIGRRGQAIAGLVLSSLELLACLGLWLAQRGGSS